jgi:hypothetical protein
LRMALTQIYRREAKAMEHLARSQGVTVDFDLSGLPASRRADGSTKGYFSGKKTKRGDN